jgi:hypothetical protein
VIDTEKLNVDILRCKLFLQRITFDEIQQSSSLWLKIEATKRLHGVSVDIQNQLETLVISSLLLDNLRNELTWDYRYALETQAGFEVIQKKIVCCNILWQALRNGNVIILVFSLSLSLSLFLYLYLYLYLYLSLSLSLI